MRKFNEQQIINILKSVEAAQKVADACRHREFQGEDERRMFEPALVRET